MKITNSLKNDYKKQTILAIILLSLLFGLAIFFGIKQFSNAADARKFNAGNIMSDFVMTNKNSMTEAQIQKFLKSKNHCNNTNIGQASQYPNMHYNIRDGHFVCMADDSFNGESAAHIIWKAAQDYSINPQVLITMLQKEQGLITDTWPNSVQYRSAMGYGCPDTAACDSKYYGLKNQVRNAANFFRAHLDNKPGWHKPYQPGYNDILWHPNKGCGNSTVYIANRTTAALYSYTPYQPNQAALNAQYGTGNSCSSYGNRNFYLYFTDWFGSTQNQSLPSCNSKVSGITCVWEIKNPKGGRFYTTSTKERDNLVKNQFWQFSGVSFYAKTSKNSESKPVYRLNNVVGTNSGHFWTSNENEKNNLVKQGAKLEGVAWYTPKEGLHNNTTYKVSRLNGPNGHVLVSNADEKKKLLSNGHVQESDNFFMAPSGMATTPTPNSKDKYIYRLNGSEHFYTTSLTERDSLLSTGKWKYEGTLTTAAKTSNTKPIYRLAKGEHFYTTNLNEKNNLAKNGWKYEGVAWYESSTANRVFRFVGGSKGHHFYTASIKEAINISNKNWKFEGVAFGKNQSSDIPVYRFRSSREHFYTTKLSEALKISNRGWTYERVAFYGGNDKTKPVYRVNKNEHFYTANLKEKNNLVKNGWKSEGIAWYESSKPTKKPVYRLAKHEHFYTKTISERNKLLKGSWRDEGIGFYVEK